MLGLGLCVFDVGVRGVGLVLWGLGLLIHRDVRAYVCKYFC